MRERPLRAHVEHAGDGGSELAAEPAPGERVGEAARGEEDRERDQLDRQDRVACEARAEPEQRLERECAARAPGARAPQAQRLGETFVLGGARDEPEHVRPGGEVGAEEPAAYEPEGEQKDGSEPGRVAHGDGHPPRDGQRARSPRERAQVWRRGLGGGLAHRTTPSRAEAPRLPARETSS